MTPPGEKATDNHGNVYVNKKVTDDHGNVYVNNNVLGNTEDTLSHEPQTCTTSPPDPDELLAFGYQERVC